MDTTDRAGHQRLSLEALGTWRDLGLGMFLHFGMSTFDGDEFSRGDRPSSTYAPDRLDVDQWVGVAADLGCRYAVLTTKHVSGHALWPSALTDYHVGTSACPTDVVEAFVAACARRGIQPGFYYCSWDNHHLLGSVTPTCGGDWRWKHTSRAYEDFQMAQLTELAKRYGAPVCWWIDIPSILSHGFRRDLYQRLAELTPSSLIMMNGGITDGVDQPRPENWPSDLIAVETRLPPAGAASGDHQGHDPWRTVLGQRYHLPGEVSDTILAGKWFWTPEARVRPDHDLLGLTLAGRSRGCNVLLNAPPDRHGRLPDDQVAALRRLRRNLDLVGG